MKKRKKKHLMVGLLFPVALYVLILICAVGGGSNRATIAFLAVIRAVSIVCIGLALVRPIKLPSSYNVLLIFLGIFALSICIQLVPIPPFLWKNIPGRGAFIEGSVLSGSIKSWRPISLTPDATFNSLLALLPAAAAILVFFRCNDITRLRIIPLLMGISIFGIMLGMVQVVSNDASPAYVFSQHSKGVPVGFFANRNHFALWLAVTIPITANWAYSLSDQRRRLGMLLAFAFSSVVLLMVLATGSRTGLALTLISLALTAAIIGRSGSNFVLNWRLGGVGAGLALITGLSIVYGRAVSLDRLIGFNSDAEQRITSLPVMMQMLRSMMPFGSGFGSFDPVFRIFEPDSLLHYGYFNHAHNDVLELAITGGIPSLLILVLFMAWWAFATIRAFKGQDRIALMGSLIVLLVGAASLTDYPVRTPFFTMVFALACCWLATGKQKIDLTLTT